FGVDAFVLLSMFFSFFFFFSSRRRHTRLQGDWSSDVCSSDLNGVREVSIFQKWLGGLIMLGAVYLLVSHPSGVYKAAQAGRQLKIGRASCRKESSARCTLSPH